MSLSPIDQKIVSALEADARLSFAALAEAVGLSKTPCWKRVKALEEAGVIRGYRTMLDPAQLGFGLEAFVQVSIDFELSEAFEAAVRKHPLIWRCHATTGDADYLLHVLAADMGALDRLLRQELSRLPGVRRTVTSMSTREIKNDVSFAEAARHVGDGKAR
ncbi:Lrp/AsnC family transcriptional regulator [Neorhizobium sp. P12A]|jgi:DNA-binding Lrp family transcriptional regulator|uniref:Lrp/AsnC family transcriptional regulator n=1 Tax=Rhizobium/Agrobacterium group TaxID=227290 RepID=UPI0010456877|nr:MULTISPECIES: Lrp/AsnC family transcriptional regulator [Rhizobium/Agrobacterium group]KAA0695680.1 Lrp/AsnC family transcriptional regulator [Neorhizobium sp. P12A]TCR80103.1 AsnC family transcriptional regulator [Rhizobium sp. BK376]